MTNNDVWSASMTFTGWIRLALGYLILSAGQNGAWALFAPRSFYDTFPGFGRTWISIDGPYNEHLIRDFGALNLALAAVFLIAAINLSRPLIVAASAAALIWGVPHLLYHLFNTDDLATSDLVASIGGLALFAGLPIALIIVSGRLPETSAAG